ncbi:hypothetical protein QBC35DRAFT_480423 [Podospora australis]|uniref:BZIP domain-containing protein n=1 Tax=Podospora australis TaxID=1536484 RepID=A0AAN6X4N2_9PEZI|nr:hypothetical protein QBC35DRAFT_480423 [Podospora australis]
MTPSATKQSTSPSPPPVSTSTSTSTSTSPSTSSSTRNRIRDNQRRSRARKKEYVAELEQRIRNYEQQGAQASLEIQAAARKVAAENAQLRALLRLHGVSDEGIAAFLKNGADTATTTPVVGVTARSPPVSSAASVTSGYSAPSIPSVAAHHPPQHPPWGYARIMAKHGNSTEHHHYHSQHVGPSASRPEVISQGDGHAKESIEHPPVPQPQSGPGAETPSIPDRQDHDRPKQVLTLEEEEERNNDCAVAADLISLFTGATHHDIRASLGCGPGWTSCQVDEEVVGDAIIKLSSPV